MDNSALKCSRPLYFINEVEEYAYSCAGTCFLIKYTNKLWAVTAKHILSNNKFEVSQALIPYDLNDRRFLPVKCAVNFTEIDDERELTDVIVFEIDEENILEPFDKSSIYDLDSETSKIEVKEALIIIHGFPDELNFIDYDEQKLHQQRASLFGRNPRISAITGCLEMELSGDGDLTSHRGFSGAPIFVIGTSEAAYKPLQLWGISLLGSTKSKTFLHVNSIKNLIQWHLSIS